MTISPIALNTGASIPALGFGTYAIKPADAAAAVQVALGIGYRLIDTAANYANEREVGLGIERSEVPRNELFVTTKLWMADFGYDAAMRAFDASLSKLNLEYLDLYLLHWPMPSDFKSTVAAYKALQRIREDGRSRAIGVSNFAAAHLRDLADACDVVPAVNQIELNPLFNQLELREENERLGIVTESWSPLGGGLRAQHLLADDEIAKIAKSIGKTNAQIVLRWHLQHGLVAIPRSTSLQHIRENFDVRDFELSETQMREIDCLDSGIRGGPEPESFDVKTYTKMLEERRRQAA